MRQDDTRPLAWRPLISVSAGLLLLASAAAAQTAPPAPVPPVSQTVLVTATAAPIPEESASRAVTVLTRDDLLQFGVSTLVDALRIAAGADPQARGPRGVQTDFSLRGATFGQSLVLADGLRLNDSQSAHHNGEVALGLLALDRIEYVAGPASAVHGADALGGTINVIARDDAHVIGTVSGGQFGTVSAEASVSGIGLPKNVLVSGWAARSGGFTADRDYALGGAVLRAQVVRGLTVDLRHERRAFGAAGFYGPSPSREWTNQTIAGGTFRGLAGRWMTQVRGAYRTHGDHFLWDVNRPGFAENHHRTHATDIELSANRDFGGGRRVTLGSGVGRDWIRSGNLGDHEYDRVSAFAEAQVPVRSRGLLQAGLRFDGYSTFGRSWSPTVSASVWPSDDVRLRASVGRAFRVPTFTERYYRDPAHQASADLLPETSWSVDGGVDWTLSEWTLGVTPFIRWDHDVIDWVKSQPADLWTTTNIRDITARGIELSASRRWQRALVRLTLTGLDLDAPDLTMLSKYVLQYARFSVSTSVTAPVWWALRLSAIVEYRDRTDGQSYALVGLRGSRTFGRVDVFVDGSNLFDVRYQEIAGVAMPGRWITAGLTIR